jgi:hypothetical protein
VRIHTDPELNRKVTTFEYDSVKEIFFVAGLQEGFQQEKASAITAYTPDFLHQKAVSRNETRME